MRLKGKLLKWDKEKAFVFIAPNGGGDDVFIHKTAFSNGKRTPQINELITFSIAKDKQGRYCANDATYSGEKLKKKQAKNVNKFSIILSILFLMSLPITVVMELMPQNIAFSYFVASAVTFIAYAFDKSKAKRGAWRTPESTLHLLALIGGWPGATVAQQTLRHKSQKKAFRITFWLTVIINISALTWLLFFSQHSANWIAIFL
jgi:uncharacterized membrane protein YsdA (DUF1294 family)/cold shock CspA family protein